jgi:hypothetical protein
MQRGASILSYFGAGLPGALFFSMLLAAAFPLWPQEQARPGDPLPFLGMGLAELVGRLGPPEAVYALRGKEEWQDDVVFVYSEGDFYIFRDRVWQVAVKSVYGLALGDSRAAALLVLQAAGEGLQDRGDYALLALPGGGWQRMLRVNFDGGRVSAIFIYRSDF